MGRHLNPSHTQYILKDKVIKKVRTMHITVQNGHTRLLVLQRMLPAAVQPSVLFAYFLLHSAKGWDSS